MADPKKQKGKRPLTKDELVEESGEESFPASDPPSFTPAEPGTPREDGEPEPAEGDAAEQPRDDIDSGRTGDGAGGESNDAEDISRNRHRERRQ